MADILNILKSILNTLQDKKKDKLVLSLDEVVEVTNIGRSRLLEIINAKDSKFPYFRNGNRILVNKEMLREWLKTVAESHETL